MGLKYNDLKDTIIKSFDIDTYEPKTGESKDVVVIAFYFKEEAAATDLYHFINNGTADINDAEVSPNPDSDGYYVVFAEMKRTSTILDDIKALVKDIENVTGKLNWQARTHLTDDYYPLFGYSQLADFVINDPEQYVTRDQYEEQLAMQQEQEQSRQSILDFVSRSGLRNIEVSENQTVRFSNGQNTADLKIAGFGLAETVMKEIGIHESALKEHDINMRNFNSMIMPLRAVRIDEYIVIFHPEDKTVLVTQEC